MLNSKYNKTLTNIILSFLSITVFLMCAYEWIIDQPFYSIERFRETEYLYRLNEVAQLSKNLIFQRQLCDNMQRSPEIFLKALSRIFPDPTHAENQFELDGLRNVFRLRYAEENLSFAVSDLAWIKFIEKQVVSPTWQASNSLLFQPSAKSQAPPITLSTQRYSPAPENCSDAD